MFTKLMRKREGGWENSDIADEGGSWVGKMLTLADKGGRGGWVNANNGG